MRLAALAALILLVAASTAAASPPWPGPPFDPYSVDPFNADCVPAGETRECDPVNVVFPGESVAQVVERLHAAGWSDTVATAQSVNGIAAQAQLAVPDGPDPTQRYHVRLWEVAPGLTVGNVHHEHGSPHRIDLAWDAAESFLAAGVCATWCGHAHVEGQDERQAGSGLWRGWPNDAEATVVPLSPPVASAPPAKPKPHRRGKRHRAHTPG